MKNKPPESVAMIMWMTQHSISQVRTYRWHDLYSLYIRPIPTLLRSWYSDQRQIMECVLLYNK